VPPTLAFDPTNSANNLRRIVGRACLRHGRFAAANPSSAPVAAFTNPAMAEAPWRPLTTGLPGAGHGIGPHRKLAVSQSAPETALYATVEAKKNCRRPTVPMIPAESWETGKRRTRPHRLAAARGAAGIAVYAGQSGSHLRREHHDVEINGRAEKTFVWLSKGAPGGR